MDQLQDKKATAVSSLSESNTAPFLEWNFKLNDKTGEKELVSIQLSDGQNNAESMIRAVKHASGTSNPKIGERILKKVARGLSSEKYDDRINEASSLLSCLEPKNSAEALLLGQFLALNDSGMKCLRLANLPDQGFYHTERLFVLAHKLLNTANQTMQTVLKYRSGGQQTVQVIHVHNEGQAIVAQNLSSQAGGGDVEKNRELNPMDHCGTVHSKK